MLQQSINQMIFTNKAIDKNKKIKKSWYFFLSEQPIS